MKSRIAAASVLASLAVLATGGAGVAAAQPPNQPSQQDQTFITQNAQTDLAEVMTGKLAAQRGTTPQIRQAAQTIMSDHQEVLSRLQGVAQNAKVTLPSTPDAMQQQEAQQLQGASGASFDQMWVQDEIKGHQQSISHTQQEIRSGSDPQVVDFAKSYLPVAQKHLQMVQHLSGTSAIGSGASPSGGNANAPSGVNAGSGGEAASSGMPAALIGGLAGGGALLVLTSGGMVLARRRQE
ncbi:MAG: DUF4142 domain-containing protein [Pseudonocardiaceae bacterium]